jgi:hypothetical protein
MPHSCGMYIALQSGAISVHVTWLATFVAYNVAPNVVCSVATCTCGWLVRVTTPLGVVIGV